MLDQLHHYRQHLDGTIYRPVRTAEIHAHRINRLCGVVDLPLCTDRQVSQYLECCWPEGRRVLLLVSLNTPLFLVTLVSTLHIRGNACEMCGTFVPSILPKTPSFSRRQSFQD